MVDNKREFRFGCLFCLKQIGCKITHEQHVKDCLSTLKLNVDYVQCIICGYPARELKRHIKRCHDLLPCDYSGQTIAAITSEQRSKVAKANDNWDWIRRANDRGDDLTEYKAKMATAVSDAIMANPVERVRRSRQLATLNKTNEFRARASKTAKRTSMREDVIADRSAQLKKWRDENQDEFYDKCISKMIGSYHSKPEIALFAILSAQFTFLKNNQRLYSALFKSVKTSRRQLDIASKEHLIAIEYDGPYHFRQLHKTYDLNGTKLKDIELNTILPQLGWVLIRISHDQWSYRSGEGFKDACIKQVVHLIEQAVPGCYKVGDAYNSDTTVCSVGVP